MHPACSNPPDPHLVLHCWSSALETPWNSMSLSRLQPYRQSRQPASVGILRPNLIGFCDRGDCCTKKITLSHAGERHPVPNSTLCEGRGFSLTALPYRLASLFIYCYGSEPSREVVPY